MTEHVKFVDYTGDYPNLCTGVLTLAIDGEELTFGIQEDCQYGQFWSSGGGCSWDDDGDYVDTDEWIIRADELPEFLHPYFHEIKKVFNANVPWGCCGGCI